MSNFVHTYLSERDGDLWLTEDERDNLKISYRIKKVVFEETSPFQHIMILDSYDFGRMLVLDGVVQTTSIDGYVYNEMISHVPLSIHPSAKRVLVIGGGDCGVAKELCKYERIEEIDMVEIDQKVVETSKEHLKAVSGNLSDPRVNFIYTDGVQFAQNKEGDYDLIIVDSSDPVGPATALFEKSFYQSLYTALKEDGLMVCQSQSPIFHKDMMRQSFKRIGDIFEETMMYTAVVPTYPGGLWSFTIGSKKYNSIISNSVTNKTSYVNEQVLQSCFSLPQFMKQDLGFSKNE